MIPFSFSLSEFPSGLDLFKKCRRDLKKDKKFFSIFPLCSEIMLLDAYAYFSYLGVGILCLYAYTQAIIKF